MAGGVVESVADAVAAVARAADVPDEVSIARETRRRARQVRRSSKRLYRQLARIEGPADTRLERRALAAARGWAAELRTLGFPVEHPLLTAP